MCNQPSSLPPTIRDRDSRQTRLHMVCSLSYVCIGRCVCPIRHMWTWRSVPDVTNRRFIGAASRIQPPASVWSTRVRRPYSQTATEPESSPATSNSDMNATARTGCCNVMKRRCWDPNSSTVPSRPVDRQLAIEAPWDAKPHSCKHRYGGCRCCFHPEQK